MHISDSTMETIYNVGHIVCDIIAYGTIVTLVVLMAHMLHATTKIGFYRNTSTRRFGTGRIRNVRMIWVGPGFILLTPKDA